MNLSTLLSFFPTPNTICALPSWDNPRLLFPAGSISERWTRSAFYPAFKTTGRLYRTALRCGVSLFPRARRIEDNQKQWPIKEFIAQSLPQAVSMSVLVGTPGPAQKATIQLRDSSEAVVGYCKYGESSGARKRLKREHEVLSALPTGFAPRSLAFGSFADGDMLLSEPLVGESVRAVLPPGRFIEEYVERLVMTEQYALEDHPWVLSMKHHMKDRSENLELLLKPLVDRTWPMAIRHGDFTPWNLRRISTAAGIGSHASEQSVVAFDWEYGSLEGFPYLDLAFYYLQTAKLIFNKEPDEALESAVAYLSAGPLKEFSKEACDSLVRMACLESYLLAEQDGHEQLAPLQRWRRALLEGVL